MINIKLIVLLVYIVETCPYQSSSLYCEICRNHILCKYNVSGPSSACRNYDKRALLNTKNIKDIVKRINERRNFIALGLSKKLPHAANMKKVTWSEDLATFAQRWADQCNPYFRPDIHDECRNLEQMEVGQNIATILNPSSELNVKSLVDIWYMQILKYIGSVSYYTPSQEETNYFTQLIWAETVNVGCGKAKFSIDNGITIVERLVCNFAPKGNVGGKTVYAIGFPATQCPEYMVPDNQLTGLCTYKLATAFPSTSRNTSATSLLKILNLSNNQSLKKEIDPIHIRFKQIKFNDSEINDQRYKKIRHVFLNNTFGSIRHISPVRVQSHWNVPTNIPTSYGLQYHQQEKGHSRIHHEYPYQNNFRTNANENANQNFRRHDFTTEHNYREDNFNQCTRKGAIDDRCKSINKQCTRGMKNDCVHSSRTLQQYSSKNIFDQSFTNLYTNNLASHEMCPCNTKHTCPTTTQSHCTCDINCQCVNTKLSLTQSPNVRRNIDNTKHEAKSKSEFHYYDLFPNLNIRSGDSTNDDSYLRNIHKPNLKLSDNSETYKYENIFNEKQVKDGFKNSEVINEKKDYLYSSFDYSERKKRLYEDEITLKPFWQMDNFKKVPQSKLLRYTTLSHRKNIKSDKTKLSAHKSTEPITIVLKKVSDGGSMQQITEKYLSFEELLHLKKINTLRDNISARRLGDDDILRAATQPSKAQTTSKASTITTTEATVNTPFVRKKHCTRKLTCTWTAPTITNADGGIIIPGGGGGSRTPPGYVEGCTRTSTCTRDYMQRNKMPTITEDSETETTIEDEDYCEKRSLNVQRRNSDDSTLESVGYRIDYMEMSAPTTVTYATQEMLSEDEVISDGCTCDETNSRRKRHNYLSPVPPISYKQLLISVFHNIMSAWKNNSLSQIGKCFCNSSSIALHCKEVVIIALFFLLLIQ